MNAHIRCNSLSVLLSAALAGVASAQTTTPVKPDESTKPSLLAPALSTDGKLLTQEVPAAAFRFELAAVPGDAKQGIKPLWVARTELRWEAFDVFVYRLDAESNPAPTDTTKPPATPSSPSPAPVTPEAKPATPKAKPAEPAAEKKPDAVTRPSKPYLPPDRGFGHDGFAAISMSHHSATQFCKWLSEKTGRTYRLPTESEWSHAALAGSTGVYCFGDDPTNLPKFAWFEPNADYSPHPVAKKEPNAWGLYDVHGNVAEWVDSATGPAAKGGSYQDAAALLAAAAKQLPEPSWNASDPQSPKSKWWLADAPFVGFRVVCEMTEDEAKVFAPTPKPAE